MEPSSMALMTEVECVNPANDYTAVCHKVVDCGNGGETIFRTANREYAEELCRRVNGYASLKEGAAKLQAELDRVTKSRDRLREKHAKIADTLKELAGSCFENRSCGVCSKHGKKPICHCVAVARAYLDEAGITYHLNTGRGK